MVWLRWHLIIATALEACYTPFFSCLPQVSPALAKRSLDLQPRVRFIRPGGREFGPRHLVNFGHRNTSLTPPPSPLAFFAPSPRGSRHSPFSLILACLHSPGVVSKGPSSPRVDQRTLLSLRIVPCSRPVLQDSGRTPGGLVPGTEMGLGPRART
jgi:hypothetical protein